MSRKINVFVGKSLEDCGVASKWITGLQDLFEISSYHCMWATAGRPHTHLLCGLISLQCLVTIFCRCTTLWNSGQLLLNDDRWSVNGHCQSLATTSLIRGFFACLVSLRPNANARTSQWRHLVTPQWNYGDLKSIFPLSAFFQLVRSAVIAK